MRHTLEATKMNAILIQIIIIKKLIEKEEKQINRES